ncbi:MAG: glycosyltransferase N-terminal domain-containing protein [Bacteroidota bacterium]
MAWKLFYNFFIVPAMWFAFKFGGFFNEKIHRGIVGRQDLLKTIKDDVGRLRSRHRLWFHASSLGEFEQAKPIITAIKQSHPDVSIIATFFSPSGYEHSKSYKSADIISYLPFDSYRQVNEFVDTVQPTAVIMVRYDVWPNLIWALQKRNIPTMIANATMKKDSIRKLFLVRQFHRGLYNCLTFILTVSDNDKISFGDFALSHPGIETIGDTRFDQVKIRSDEAAKKQILPNRIIKGKKIFVVGQSWDADDSVVLPVLFKIQKRMPELLAILVPHEPTIEHLEQIENRLEGETSFIRFSGMNQYAGEKVILVDSVGILVPLYKYAQVAYVGGSFRQGVHNVLEPAAFSLPVLYGPKHTNSQEAIALAEQGGGFVVKDEKDLYRILRTLLENEPKRLEAGKKARHLVDKNLGATDRFLKYLTPLLTPL